jgi:hypothetical protein
MDMKKQVANILRKIETDKLSEKELDAVYDNAEAHKDLDETDREIILDAVMKKLWTEHPTRAKKRFGTKELFAQELLQPVFDKSKSLFDLSANKVLNKVKIGGDMRRGDAFVDIYISYKDDARRRVSLDVRQETADRVPTCSVKELIVGSGDDGLRTEFPLQDFDIAAELYLSKLAEVLPATQPA